MKYSRNDERRKYEIQLLDKINNRKYIVRFFNCKITFSIPPLLIIEMLYFASINKDNDKSASAIKVLKIDRLE